MKNQRFVFFPKDVITLEKQMTISRELLSASLFLPFHSIKEHFCGKTMGQGQGDTSWSACSVTDWPCKDKTDRTSLVVQWLRLHLPMQETRAHNPWGPGSFHTPRGN